MSGEVLVVSCKQGKGEKGEVGGTQSFSGKVTTEL